MTKNLKTAVTAFAVACIVMGVVSSCQAGSAGKLESADDPTDRTVVIRFEGDRGTFVPPITVKRGESVRFVAEGGTAYILFPDANLRQETGGIEWAIAPNFVAFTVDKEGATLLVPPDYPPSDEVIRIYYSVLCDDGVSAPYYAEGENPPPHMEIPPVP